MIEYGKVIAIDGDKAHIHVQRHAACGDCGACHVGKNQLEMKLIADNTVGAKVGDQVELTVETVDVLSAAVIMYGIPLLALVIGIFGGFYGLTAVGLSSDMAQAFGAIIGLLLMAGSYLGIKSREQALNKNKKFKPVITSIRNDNI